MSARQPWPGWGPRQGPGGGGRILRTLVVCGVVAVLVLAGVAAGGVWWATDHYGDRVTRIPHAFPSGPRPTGSAAHHDGTTFLVAGVDSRSTRPTTGTDATARLWTYGAQRSDTLMLIHLAPGKGSASVLSIPRDSWVPVPGHGSAKINAAFSWGGPPLLIRTVEQLTGTRVDHFGVIDWHGFKSLTDAVGGVPVTVDGTSYDPELHHRFTAGTHLMKGDEALAYVRQRHGVPGGDLARIQRQQRFLRALLARVRGNVSLTDPLATHRMLDAITRTVSVDDHMSNGDLRDLVVGLRHLGASDTQFSTAPVVRAGWVGRQSVLILDRTQLRARCRALASGNSSVRGGAS
ncbi:LCP family protein [Streptomyces panaciradicis]|uniref:LCP family protein n=1 Tax=Streptomyces panaciradicis TaxID=1470261 RepID=UPI00201D0AB4|nr:LCP family protein [Streptomyces panaciradicis]MCL6670388.1 LCP family protein [Streptomyces panaciradicis]